MALTVEKIDEAIESVLNGGQRVVINGHTYERANLAELWQLRKSVAVETAVASGGGGMLIPNLSGANR